MILLLVIEKFYLLMTWWHAETSSRTRLSRNCIWNLYLDTKIVIYDAYDDAFAQDDEISAADQRQIWRQSSICQQTSQQTPAITNTGQTAKCTEQGNFLKILNYYSFNWSLKSTLPSHLIQEAKYEVFLTRISFRP